MNFIITTDISSTLANSISSYAVAEIFIWIFYLNCIEIKVLIYTILVCLKMSELNT